MKLTEQQADTLRDMAECLLFIDDVRMEVLPEVTA